MYIAGLRSDSPYYTADQNYETWLRVQTVSTEMFLSICAFEKCIYFIQVVFLVQK